MLNETAVPVLYIEFLFLNQSSSIIKKMTPINVTLLNKTHILSLPPKSFYSQDG